MRFDELNEDNFLYFAIKNYENPQAVTKEDFNKDLNHFKYIKRLLKRYKKTGEIRTHLLINHFLILYNVFGEATTPMLFLKMEREMWSQVKTFILFLNKLPQYPKSYIISKPNTEPGTLVGASKETIQAETLDKNLLKLISDKARLPLLEIATRLKTSPQVIKNHMRKANSIT